MQTQTIDGHQATVTPRSLGCPITRRDSDGRVLVRYRGELHWVTPRNYNGLARRGHVVDTLGQDVPLVESAMYLTFKKED